MSPPRLAEGELTAPRCSPIKLVTAEDADPPTVGMTKQSAETPSPSAIHFRLQPHQIQHGEEVARPFGELQAGRQVAQTVGETQPRRRQIAPSHSDADDEVTRLRSVTDGSERIAVPLTDANAPVAMAQWRKLSTLTKFCEGAKNARG
jgi:hypothetical protein